MIKNLFKSFVLLSLFFFVLNFNLVAKSQDVPTSPYPVVAPTSPYPKTTATAPTSPYPIAAVPTSPYPTAVSAPTSPYPTAIAPTSPYPTPTSLQPTSQALPPTATQRNIAATGQVAQAGVQKATAILGKETRGTQAAGVAAAAAPAIGTTGMKAAQELRQIDTGLRPGETQAERAARVSQAGAQAVTPAIKEVGKAAVEIAAMFRKPQPAAPMQQPLALMKAPRDPIFYDDTVELYFDLWKKRGKPSYLDSSGGVLGIDQTPAESSKWILTNPYQTPRQAFRSGDVVILYNPETSSYMKIGNKKEITAEQLEVMPTKDGFKWYVFDLDQIDPKILTQAGKDFLKGKIKGMPIGNPITDGSKVAIGNFAVTSKANNEHRWLRLASQGVFKSKTPKLAPELQKYIKSQETFVIKKATQAPIPGQAPMIEYPRLDEISAIEIETTPKTPMIEDKPEIDLPELPEAPSEEEIVSITEAQLTEANKDFAALRRLGKDELEILEQEYVVAELESKVAHEKRLYFGTRVINYMERCQKIIEVQSADIAAKLTELFNQENANLETIAQGLELADLEKGKNQNEKAAKLQQRRIDLGLALELPARGPAARPGPPPPIPPRDAKVETTEPAEEPEALESQAALGTVATGATPPPPPPPPPAPKGTSAPVKKESEAKVQARPETAGLMAQIEAGKELKKAIPVETKPEEQKSGDFMSSVAAEIVKRRSAIAEDDEDDAEGEWDPDKY